MSELTVRSTTQPTATLEMNPAPNRKNARANESEFMSMLADQQADSRSTSVEAAAAHAAKPAVPTARKDAPAQARPGLKNQVTTGHEKNLTKSAPKKQENPSQTVANAPKHAATPVSGEAPTKTENTDAAANVSPAATTSVTPDANESADADTTTIAKDAVTTDAQVEVNAESIAAENAADVTPSTDHASPEVAGQSNEQQDAVVAPTTDAQAQENAAALAPAAPAANMEVSATVMEEEISVDASPAKPTAVTQQTGEEADVASDDATTDDEDVAQASSGAEATEVVDASGVNPEVATAPGDDAQPEASPAATVAGERASSTQAAENASSTKPVAKQSEKANAAQDVNVSSRRRDSATETSQVPPEGAKENRKDAAAAAPAATTAAAPATSAAAAGNRNGGEPKIAPEQSRGVEMRSARATQIAAPDAPRRAEVLTPPGQQTALREHIVTGEMIAPGLLKTTSPSTTSPVASSATASPFNQAAFIDSLLQQARVLTRPNGATEMQIALDPPELGPVEVKLVMRDDRIHAVIQVDSQGVRDAMESLLPKVRQALAGEGLNLDQFNVDLRRQPDQAGQAFDRQERAREEAAQRGSGSGERTPRVGTAPGANRMRHTFAGAATGAIDFTA